MQEPRRLSWGAARRPSGGAGAGGSASGAAARQPSGPDVLPAAAAPASRPTALPPGVDQDAPPLSGVGARAPPAPGKAAAVPAAGADAADAGAAVPAGAPAPGSEDAARRAALRAVLEGVLPPAAAAHLEHCPMTVRVGTCGGADRGGAPAAPASVLTELPAASRAPAASPLGARPGAAHNTRPYAPRRHPLAPPTRRPQSVVALLLRQQVAAAAAARQAAARDAAAAAAAAAAASSGEAAERSARALADATKQVGGPMPQRYVWPAETHTAGT
jgi:hypothetical protein